MKQNNKKFNNAMHKFVGVLDKYGKITNALMKWLENTVKLCLLLIILRLESFVETGVRDLENVNCFSKIIRVIILW